MAGIFDDVMAGIAAKEKDGKTPATPPAAPPATPPAPPAPGQQTTPPAEGKNPMNTYSDDFKNKYGDRSGKPDEKKT